MRCVAPAPCSKVACCGGGGGGSGAPCKWCGRGLEVGGWFGLRDLDNICWLASQGAGLSPPSLDTQHAIYPPRTTNIARPRFVQTSSTNASYSYVTHAYPRRRHVHQEHGTCTVRVHHVRLLYNTCTPLFVYTKSTARARSCTNLQIGAQSHQTRHVCVCAGIKTSIYFCTHKSSTSLPSVDNPSRNASTLT